MKTIILLTLIVFGVTPMFCQTLCNIPGDERVKILDCLFADDEFKSYDKVYIKNNFVTSCFRSNKYDNRNVFFSSEKTLYRNLISNYYTVEKIDYTGNIATIIMTQRSIGAFITYLLVKDINGWEIQNKNKVNGRLKTDDFLYQSIRLKQKG